MDLQAAHDLKESKNPLNRMIVMICLFLSVAILAFSLLTPARAYSPTALPTAADTL